MPVGRLSRGFLGEKGEVEKEAGATTSRMIRALERKIRETNDSVSSVRSETVSMIANGANIAVRYNSTLPNVGSRPRLNFVPGTGITLAVADDSANDEIDITPTVDNSVVPYGTGEAGYVTIWSDANTVTRDSILFWDFTNNRLGIGTATPANDLSIVGTSADDNIGDLGIRHDARWSQVFIDSHSSGDPSHSPFLILRRSRGSFASRTTVANGDNLGYTGYRAYDGTNYLQTCLIRAEVIGTVATNSAPTDFVIGVSAGPHQPVPSERLRISGGNAYAQFTSVNVGIGVQPTSVLHLRTTTTPQFKIDNNSTNTWSFGISALGVRAEVATTTAAANADLYTIAKSTGEGLFTMSADGRFAFGHQAGLTPQVGHVLGFLADDVVTPTGFPTLVGIAASVTHSDATETTSKLYGIVSGAFVSTITGLSATLVAGSMSTAGSSTNVTGFSGKTLAAAAFKYSASGSIATMEPGAIDSNLARSTVPSGDWAHFTLAWFDGVTVGNAGAALLTNRPAIFSSLAPTIQYANGSQTAGAPTNEGWAIYGRAHALGAGNMRPAVTGFMRVPFPVAIADSLTRATHLMFIATPHTATLKANNSTGDVIFDSGTNFPIGLHESIGVGTMEKLLRPSVNASGAGPIAGDAGAITGNWDFTGTHNIQGSTITINDYASTSGSTAWIHTSTRADIVGVPYAYEWKATGTMGASPTLSGHSIWKNAAGTTLMDIYRVSSTDVRFRLGAVNFEMTDAFNMIFGTTTGTKIGSGTTEKIALWGKTPIIQPAGALQAALTNSTGGAQDGTLVDVTTLGVADPAKVNDNFTDIYALLDAMRTAMVNFGSMKGAA